jgi:hypothetical protein
MTVKFTGSEVNDRKWNYFDQFSLVNVKMPPLGTFNVKILVYWTFAV